MKLRVGNICWRILVVVLCQLLALPPLLAQAGQGGFLRVVVTQGAGARNNLQSISPQPIIVRIEDASGRPVGGARVAFTAPVAGPGGTFDNDTYTISATSGADGVASSGPYRANGVAGQYMIAIRADFQNLVGTTTIQQTNYEKKSRGKLIAILAAGGGVAGAVIASKKLKDNQAPAPIITFGTSAVGAPGQ